MPKPMQPNPLTLPEALALLAETRGLLFGLSLSARLEGLGARVDVVALLERIDSAYPREHQIAVLTRSAPSGDPI